CGGSRALPFRGAVGLARRLCSVAEAFEAVTARVHHVAPVGGVPPRGVMGRDGFPYVSPPLEALRYGLTRQRLVLPLALVSPPWVRLTGRRPAGRCRIDGSSAVRPLRSSTPVSRASLANVALGALSL